MKEHVACEVPLSAEDVQRHVANCRALLSMVQEVRHLDDGWALRLPDTPETLERLATFLELNRRCCTHIRHAVGLEPFQGPLWLGAGPIRLHAE